MLLNPILLCGMLLAPATGPAPAVHTVVIPGRGEMRITLPKGSSAEVGRVETTVLVEISAPFKRPAGAPVAATRPATATSRPAATQPAGGAKYVLTFSLSEVDRDLYGDAVALREALVRSAPLMTRVPEDRKVPMRKLGGQVFPGCYYTLPTLNDWPEKFVTMGGVVLPGDMAITFAVFHPTEDAPEVEHALSIVRRVEWEARAAEPTTNRATTRPLSPPPRR